MHLIIHCDSVEAIIGRAKNTRSFAIWAIIHEGSADIMVVH